MTAEIINYATILMELVKAVKMHNFYPHGHPQLEAILERTYRHLKSSANEKGELKWYISQRGFSDENKSPLAAGNPEVASLAKKLFFRRVKELTFTQLLEPTDLTVFLSAVNMEPEELQANGGAEAYFASMDIKGLLLNELRYDDIRKLKAELVKKKDEEDKALAEKKQQDEQPSGEAAKNKEKEKEPPKKQAPPEEDLPTLAGRLMDENDPLRYKDLAVRILGKLEAFLLEGRVEEVSHALILFYDHSREASDKCGEVKKIAFESLKGHLTRDMLKYLASQAGAKDLPRRDAVHGMLLHGGQDAAELLLDEITTAPTAAMRRHLFNSLVPFGPLLRPLAEARLVHTEWYVTRQMVALLGEVGGAETLPALEDAYRSPEPRVKKEVLKGMVKINSPRVTEFLLSVLREENQSLVAQAIISLGILKDPLAIDPLVEIASRKDSSSESVSREAIKALGVIGDARAVPHIEKILFRKVWFGKKSNEETRALAALSLGIIGTAEAIKAVESAYAGSTGELHAACKRVLEGRGEPHERRG